MMTVTGNLSDLLGRRHFVLAGNALGLIGMEWPCGEILAVANIFKDVSWPLGVPIRDISSSRD